MWWYRHPSFVVTAGGSWVQSLFAGHVSLHRSHSPISIIGSVDSVELELDCNLQSISASIEAVCRKTLQDVNRDPGQNPRSKISVKNYICQIESSPQLAFRRVVYFNGFFPASASFLFSASLLAFVSAGATK